jgi:antitoxin (DNA-binding transcriptional repressor) of toxin-antitoxin stability system
MRNSSGEILRAVAAGEIFQVTNNGQVAALISPPTNDALARLEEQGHLRPPRRPVTDLSGIHRGTSSLTSRKIIDDARGRW